jgi:hypothetical protein
VVNDFGSRTKRRKPIGKYLIGGGLTVSLAALVGVFLWRGSIAHADAVAWTVKGPACEELGKDQFAARGLMGIKVSNYETITVSREDGAVSCASIRNDGGYGLGDYPVCQFSHPVAVVVRDQNGDHFFDTHDRPATISTAHGKVSCVMAARYAADGLPPRS